MKTAIHRLSRRRLAGIILGLVGSTLIVTVGYVLIHLWMLDPKALLFGMAFAIAAIGISVLVVWAVCELDK